ncbi:MAG TPA: ATP-dependent protease subunit HslV [bacterium]|jgi:ATP-dependent HslUV protease subunit HslV
MEQFHGTTVIGVRLNGETALAADGQVTFGTQIMKSTAKKIMKLHNDKVLIGFAGAVADAQTLAERFEAKLDEYRGNLPRAAVELAREWRMDKYLRRLESMLLAGDKDTILLISGSGEVLQPDGEAVAIGSGGGFALAAARVMLRHTGKSAREIAEESLKVASEICIYTNDHVTIESVS